MGWPVRVILFNFTNRMEHVVRLGCCVVITLEGSDVETALAAARLLEATLEGLRALPRVE